MVLNCVLWIKPRFELCLQTMFPGHERSVTLFMKYVINAMAVSIFKTMFWECILSYVSKLCLQKNVYILLAHAWSRTGQLFYSGSVSIGEISNRSDIPGLNTHAVAYLFRYRIDHFQSIFIRFTIHFPVDNDSFGGMKRLVPLPNPQYRSVSS